jgi:transposase
MRGHVDPQGSMFSYFSPDSRVPETHPLRPIKADADKLLATLSSKFDELYAATGRPSIPPERLLKASLLIALYTVRSDRLFCEMLDYNILFRWFLDMSLEEKGLDQSNFSRLRERLVSSDLACRFFDTVVSEARKRNLLSDEHFTVDGTLIEAWASTAKSLRRKDAAPSDGGPDDQGMVNFRGERRSNDTHESKTDPEAKLFRKGKGRETKLYFGGHALMENRNGLCVEMQVRPVLQTEPEATKELLARQARKGVRPTTLGADKGYHTKDFVAHLRKKNIAPHIAQIEGRNTPGLDARTTRHRSYEISQRKRKRVEEIFGWMKSYGGLRRTMARGLARVRLHAYIVGAAYNLLRMSRLRTAAGGLRP